MVFASGDGMASLQPLPVSGTSHDFNENSKFFNKEFDAIAQEALSFYHVPGLAIGVIHKGKTYAKVYIHHSPTSSTCSYPLTFRGGGEGRKIVPGFNC
jgi:hypothetical protein